MQFFEKYFLIVIGISILIIPNLNRQSKVIAAEPNYVIKHTTEKNFIDGNITENDWSAVERVTPFVFPWYKEGKKEQTMVKLLWDEQFLYVLFQCEDEHIAAHHFERNSAVSRDDCVEIFIAPNKKQPLWYANYELNCLGTWLVGMNKGKDRKNWEPEGILAGRSHKGTINKEDDIDLFWLLEFAIPFKNFQEFGVKTPPQDGDAWRLNLNRCGGDVNQQYSQWKASNTPQPNYHRPQDFGTVVFSVKPVR